LPWAFVVSLVAAVLAFVTSTFFLRPISPESAPDRHYVPMGKAIAHRG